MPFDVAFVRGILCKWLVRWLYTWHLVAPSW
jgi:hypothetical protein